MTDSNGQKSLGDSNARGLIGLAMRVIFTKKLDEILNKTTECTGGVIYFDIERFTLINNMFGMSEGDKLLLHIANELKKVVDSEDMASHFGADRFAFFVSGNKSEVTIKVQDILNNIANYNLPFGIKCNAGIFLVEGPGITAAEALDGAVLAQKVIKADYIRHIGYYNDDIKQKLYEEQRYVGLMKDALRDEEFVVYYQPQYNHSTGTLFGAEALVRWQNPTEGLILPGKFIHIFEETGFIVNLDEYVFKVVCKFLKNQIEMGIKVVPISVNLTRYDIFYPGFIERIEKIRRDFDVPAKMIRIEITESSAYGNAKFINSILDKLHEYGYVVEMDDFGSGYSSLSILKNLNFDVIKLDTRFFGDSENDEDRGGIILSSVVRMINWLQTPIIAEGVEKIEQAKYLKSIGCDMVQGFLYSKPLPEDEFAALLRMAETSKPSEGMKINESMNALRFWNSNSMDTVIFSDFLGSAAIFEYDSEMQVLELMRVNEKLVKELGMNMSECEILDINLFDCLDPANLEIFKKALDDAIETGNEKECEVWCEFNSKCCGDEKVCLRFNMRILANIEADYIGFCLVRNVTNEKERINNILDSERRFMAASEQVNIYYWEYTVATHEMRPCFRCMRDLGLPALLKNYPDSAIEMGVFPPEIADEYREWHRRIDSGEVRTLEKVLPLTVGRIPFHVRYTTEFDDFGKPIKAYGSAALVVD